MTIRQSIVTNNYAFDAGGISCRSSTLTISECTIENNVAETRESACGIGVYGNVNIDQCDIVRNRGHTYATAIDIGGTATITNCNISDNGVMGIKNHGTTTINNSTIQNNRHYGGIWHHGPALILNNCVITGNEGWYMCDEAGINHYGSALTVNNCTISDNITCDPDRPGGIRAYGPFSLTNSILWGNTGSQINNDNPSSYIVIYSDIDQDGFAGINGNIREDPCFHVNYTVGDGVVEAHPTYHLQPDSPCIDAGTSDNAPNVDIDGDERPWGAGFDMGADEYIPPEDYWTPPRMRDAIPPDMRRVVPGP